jgi:type I restriction enzyme R subunit
MSEAQTRKNIIDKRLLEAGWDASDPSLVISEHEILHQHANTTGIGYSDYILLGKDGVPLAVVEAKKSTTDAEKGREQARQYADGLQKMYGVRPFIFYTNGYDIYFWDETLGPPRKAYGFFTREDLETKKYQNDHRRPLSTSLIDENIVNRPYQIEAIRSTLEHFGKGHRKALLVMATGSGKTRTAMALVDVLIRSNWTKRILFLADRKELLKQARNAFKEHLPHQPWCIVKDGKCPIDKRVYLSTYPSMRGIYSQISSGFFDLIIADESHRSIYKHYAEIFKHFDSYQIGLTATPVRFVNRNTFSMFELREGVPTFNYSFDDAVKEKHLVNFKVMDVRTQYQVGGIKWDQLDTEIQQQIIDDGIDPDLIDFEGDDLEKKVTNSDTTDLLVQEFMDGCIRDPSGTSPGKSIIFAISHKHAMRIEKSFNRLYPEYKGFLARVIDSHDPRANTDGGLLDQFKDPNSLLKVAISVDMLDTGVDVPEVVNLVFAKPVFSWVKFWQMIGRGTRLCKNLFGPNKDKEHFLIFDHWKNFEYFGENPEGRVQPVEGVSIPERVFTARLRLAESLLHSDDKNLKDFIVSELKKDIAALPEASVVVKDSAAHVAQVKQEPFWAGFSDHALTFLRNNILRLMRSRQGEDFDALMFDIDVMDLERGLLTNDQTLISSMTEKIIEKVSELPLTLNQVIAKEQIITSVKEGRYFNNMTFETLEHLRKELRGIMKLRDTFSAVNFLELNIRDLIAHKVMIEFGAEGERLPVAEYRALIEEKIKQMLVDNPLLQKIKDGKSVNDYEVATLAEILNSNDPYITEENLRLVYDNRRAHFLDFIKHILGLSLLPTRTEDINSAFDAFIAKHNSYTKDQIQFIRTVKTFIVDQGSVKREDLVERPFTNIHPLGIRGLFGEFEIVEIEKFIEEMGRLAA